MRKKQRTSHKPRRNHFSGKRLDEVLCFLRMAATPVIEYAHSLTERSVLAAHHRRSSVLCHFKPDFLHHCNQRPVNKV